MTHFLRDCRKTHFEDASDLFGIFRPSRLDYIIVPILSSAIGSKSARKSHLALSKAVLRQSLSNKFLFFIAFTFAPLFTIANPPAHKPPILTTTAIIEIYDHGIFQGIVLIERGKAPFGKALPGGKVEYGETVENAVRREMQEEVHLELQDLRQFHVYSDPTRDFRHHSVEVTHLAKSFCLPIAGDDAAKAFLVKLDEIPWDELAFDHAQILQDYIDYKNGNTEFAMVKP